MKFLYQFSAGESFVHRLDPRTKLVVILCFLIMTFITPQPWIMPLIVIFILWVGAKVKLSEYYPFLLFLLPLMIGITLIHLLTDPGPFFFSLGFLRFSAPGLQTGLAVAFRLAAMGLAFMLFSMTTDPFDWGLAMYKSGLPYRIAFMFAFAMRVFPLIQEELAVIRNALSARAYEAVGSAANPVAFLRGAVISVFPLIAGAMRRSQEIAMAMELRGLSCAEEMGVQRTVFRDIRLRRRDYVVMSAAFLFLVAFLLVSAAMGALPALSAGQITFGVILITCFSLVAWRIAKVISGD